MTFETYMLLKAGVCSLISFVLVAVGSLIATRVDSIEWHIRFLGKELGEDTIGLERDRQKEREIKAETQVLKEEVKSLRAKELVVLVCALIMLLTSIAIFEIFYPKTRPARSETTTSSIVINNNNMVKV